MTQGWAVGKLAQLARVRSGFAFKSSQWTDAGVPVVKIGNVKRGRLDMEGCSFVTEDDALRSGFLLSDGDILIGLTGYVGEVAKVRNFGPLVLNQRVGKFYPTIDCDPEFLFFLVSNDEFRQRVEAASHGSAQANVSPSAIEAFEVLIPPLHEQRAIAATLGVLDDKIELNRKMNATLEAMARALFRDWFVDFGPTRAKMEARAPYLSPDLWSLFPARLDAEGKPEGWEEKPLTEFFAIIGGGTPKTSNADFWDGPIPWFSVTDTPPNGSVFVTDTEKTITEAGLNGSSARLVQKGTTIISARGTVGNLAVAGRDMTFNQSCYGLRGAGSVGDYATYLIAQNMVSQLQAMAHGSVFSTITRQTFESLALPIPTDSVLRAFEDAVSPLFDMILANVHESRTLAQTRDLLLPRLMSGELRVAEAEGIIKEVA